MSAGHRSFVCTLAVRARLVFARGRVCCAIALAVAATQPMQTARAAGDMPGVTATEIRIGNVMPATGRFAEYGSIARAEAAYFRFVNDEGGVNGRRIVYTSLDSGSNSAQEVELSHHLIEDQQVLLLVSNFGEEANLALRPYMNEHHVPQLFVGSPSAVFDDPAHYPWTMGFEASRRTEASAYAKYLLRNRPDAKIGVLAGSDAGGREYADGFRAGLGDKAATMIVKEEHFSYGDPAEVDAHVEALKNAGADVFVNMAIGRYATEAIRRAGELGWHPLQFVPNASLSAAAFLDPAGTDNARGIVSNARSKGWATAKEREDPAVRAFVDWMHTYNPDANPRDAGNVYGYEVAQTLVDVLKSCGSDLSRDNVMKHAASLDMTLGMLRPGIRITTSPTDYRPVKQLYLVRFNGENWEAIGDISGD